MSESYSGGPVTVEGVQAAAKMVALPLSQEESVEVAALLSQWIPGASALSERLQSQELDTLTPITTFTSPLENPSADDTFKGHTS